MSENDMLFLISIILGLWLFINWDGIMESLKIENNLVNSIVSFTIIYLGTMLFLSLFTSKGIETFFAIW